MQLISVYIKYIIIIYLIIITPLTFAKSINITGAGATFPAPIYAKWADSYQKKYGIKINYQDIGSSSGVKQIIANTVDFGASDTPLSKEQLQKNNLFQFPTVIGGIVLIINVPGIKNGELTLNGKTLGNIYLGKIQQWNDIAITKLNPTLKLPDQAIAVVRRADGSGTSFVFTNYLAKVNVFWKQIIGIGSSVNWPIGFGGKGNDGVAAFVQRIPGSIGYVEYAYAKQNHLPCINLTTANGISIAPTRQSFSAATKNINWNNSFIQDLTNQLGNNAWPITSTTFILLHKQNNQRKQCKEVLNFFNWAYDNGSTEANDLDYVLLPKTAINHIRMAWKIELKDSHNNSIW